MALTYEIVAARNVPMTPSAQLRLDRLIASERDHKNAVYAQIARRVEETGHLVFHPVAFWGRMARDPKFRNIPVEVTVPRWLFCMLRILHLCRIRVVVPF